MATATAPAAGIELGCPAGTRLPDGDAASCCGRDRVGRFFRTNASSTSADARAAKGLKLSLLSGSA